MAVVRELPSWDELNERVEALTAANARLQDEVDLLKAEKIGHGFLAPVEWGLTGKEMGVFGLLMERDLASRDNIMFALYSDRIDDWPEAKIVDVFVCKLRKKVEAFGILIETRWGKGYFMSPAMKGFVRELIAESPTMGQAA